MLVALGGALGTQIWSSASRTVGPDTWTALLLGIVILMLLLLETEGLRISPILLATLLSFSYFVRPTNSISILAISIYIFIFHRRLFTPLLITGTAWLAFLVAYSWHLFGQPLPNYFQANRLKFHLFWTAVAGNLISPSRGLFIYVPILFYIAFLLSLSVQWMEFADSVQ